MTHPGAAASSLPPAGASSAGSARTPGTCSVVCWSSVWPLGPSGSLSSSSIRPSPHRRVERRGSARSTLVAAHVPGWAPRRDAPGRAGAKLLPRATEAGRRTMAEGHTVEFRRVRRGAVPSSSVARLRSPGGQQLRPARPARHGGGAQPGTCAAPAVRARASGAAPLGR